MSNFKLKLKQLHDIIYLGMRSANLRIMALKALKQLEDEWEVMQKKNKNTK